VRFFIMDPDREVVGEEEWRDAIPPGVRVYPLRYEIGKSSPCQEGIRYPARHGGPRRVPSGIWHVSYELLDDLGLRLQPRREAAEGRFAVAGREAVLGGPWMDRESAATNGLCPERPGGATMVPPDFAEGTVTTK
jgi:hypothetical protein